MMSQTTTPPRARVKAKRPFAWLRRLMLVLALLMIVGITILLLAYRFASSGSGGGSSALSSGVNTDPEVRVSGTRFDFTQTSEGRPIYRIRAETDQHTVDGTIQLGQVDLEIYRQDGSSYFVRSEQAVFREDGGEAVLRGNVVLSGWDSLVLKTRELHLRSGGEVLYSDGKVRFAYAPDLEGQASKLRVDFRSDSIVLSDGVHIRSIPGAANFLRLDSERLYYQPNDGLIRAHGGAVLVRDQQRIEGETLTVFFQDDLNSLKTLRARWDVRGVLTSAGDLGARTQAEISGYNLTLHFDEASGEPTRLDLEGSAESGPAQFSVVDDSGLGRQLLGSHLTGHFGGGRLQTLSGAGKPLRITEVVDVDPPYILRRLCARRAEARFLADGSLALITLEEQVELQDREVQLSGGDRATLDIVAGKVAIQGAEVALYSERGEVIAPSLEYNRRSGLIRGRGGVRTVLPAGSLNALERTPLGQGSGPIRIESKEAVWNLSPPSFSFLGGVRAWRGDSLLLADQLRGEQQLDQLAASGEVSSVWIPAGGDLLGEAAQPIKVKAERLSYRGADLALVYDGNVRVEQGQRILSCRELTVELSAASRQAERMYCRDSVRLDDPVASRRVFGDSAIYTLARREVEVFGKEVRLVDGQGNELSGRYLIYDLSLGTVALSGKPPVDHASQNPASAPSR